MFVFCFLKSFIAKAGTGIERHKTKSHENNQIWIDGCSALRRRHKL